MKLKYLLLILPILFWLGCEETAEDCTTLTHTMTLASAALTEAILSGNDATSECSEAKAAYKAGLDAGCDGYNQTNYDGMGDDCGAKCMSLLNTASDAIMAYASNMSDANCEAASNAIQAVIDGGCDTIDEDPANGIGDMEDSQGDLPCTPECTSDANCVALYGDDYICDLYFGYCVLDMSDNNECFSDSDCVNLHGPGYECDFWENAYGGTDSRCVLYGCTDPEASNYNSDAEINDGSCYHDVLTDIDGNEYHAVQIGDQLWMKENLKVTHYRNGDEIPTGYSNEEWINLSTGAYAVYLDDESNADTYGYLYNWYAVDDSRNIAPEGWHVPTDDELSILYDFVEGASGKALKEIGFEHWEDPGEEYHQYYEGLDIYGFTGLPGGSRSGSSGGYGSMGLYGNFWSATADSSYSAAAWWWTLRANFSDFDRGLSGVSYNNGGSIRCVKD
jgi:uncharacterized protein (TIGR02145 family)|tara:strand:- start:3353 stop:4696 length:1344 start_codon:yes stop_codon:yes gene_type:complete